MYMCNYCDSYVLGSVYSKYSLSTASDTVFGFLASASSFTSGYMSARHVSPPIVSHASAGKTLAKKWNGRWMKMKMAAMDIIYCVLATEKQGTKLMHLRDGGAVVDCQSI